MIKLYLLPSVLKLLLRGNSNPTFRYNIVKTMFLDNKSIREKVKNLFKHDTDSLFSQASKNGLLDIMKLLVHDSVVSDINLGTPPPLWHAINSGHEEIVKWLMGIPTIERNKPYCSIDYTKSFVRGKKTFPQEQ